MQKMLPLSLCLVAGAVLGIGTALHVQAGTPAPVATGNGDVNGDGVIDISDAVYILLYLYRSGQAPAMVQDRPELIARLQQLETDLNACNGELETARASLAEKQVALAETKALLDECVNKLPTKPAYVVTGLGFLPGRDKSSGASAINDKGQIVGNSGSKAFIWESGVLKDLGNFDGAERNNVTDINNKGTIVGTSYFSGGSLAFLIEGGVMRPLLVTPGSTYSQATAINDGGQIIGLESTMFVGILWHNDSRTVLGTFSPEGINNLGQIVGFLRSAPYHASFWQNGDTTDLPGGDSSVASRINDNGQIVGTSRIGQGNHAVIWRSITSPIEDLGSLPGRGVRNAFASSINNQGKVVGQVDVSPESYQVYSIIRAFVWEEGKGMLDLNNLIDPSSRWTLLAAADVNNVGQIVGAGVDPDGYTEAFLLTPTP